MLLLFTFCFLLDPGILGFRLQLTALKATLELLQEPSQVAASRLEALS